MTVLAANERLITDGDAAFLRVDSSRPPHALEPGVAASARNKRSEQGKMMPRFGIDRAPWGEPVLFPRFSSSTWPTITISGWYGVLLTGFVSGKKYVFDAGNTAQMWTATLTPSAPDGTQIAEGEFTATQTTYYLFTQNPGADPLLEEGSLEYVISATVTPVLGVTCAYKRFSDPFTNTDNTILITDDWRDLSGEDGGRGRAWRIIPGNGPQAISLNGHSVWGTARLIQCHNAMVLLRHGNERHYFSASNVNDALNDRITLTAAPSWATGIANAKRVRFELASTGAAIYGQDQTITDSDAAADTITVAAHGLANGTGKVVTGITGASGVYYVRSASANTLSLYDTAAHAIAGGATGLFDITVNDETGTLTDRPPAAGNYYYAHRVSGAIIELYSDAACTNKLLYSTVTSPVGKFFIELATDPPPFFGNGAPNLILQPNAAGSTAFEVGFAAVPANVEITGTTASVISAANHRLRPGDQVEITGPTLGTAAPHYAYPLTAHTFTIHSTQANAILGASAITTITPGGTGSFYKTGAARNPMPPCREGAYINGRFIGINGRDEVVISDPFDFLHFTLFQQQVPANQGESGNANWILPLGKDAASGRSVVAVGKDLNILGLVGLSGASTGWSEGVITSEHGGTSALGAIPVGSDIMCVTRKGLASIIRTAAGETLGVARTVSEALKQQLQELDWNYASQCALETWNGRLFWAWPAKGQTNPAVNNRVAVLNFNNQQLYLEQEAVAGEMIGSVRKLPETQRGPDSWEGTWDGDLLEVYSFAKLKVNGEERLTFASPDGWVCWFTDGFTDGANMQIEDELVTRGYFGGRKVLALRGAVNWETWNPQLTVVAKCAGYNEQATLIDELEYSVEEYSIDGQTDYDPETADGDDFEVPHRHDYSPTSDLGAGPVDVHQSHTEPLRMRIRDRAIQLVISNAQGSARVCGVTVQGAVIGQVGTGAT